MECCWSDGYEPSIDYVFPAGHRPRHYTYTLDPYNISFNTEMMIWHNNKEDYLSVYPLDIPLS